VAGLRQEDGKNVYLLLFAQPNGLSDLTLSLLFLLGKGTNQWVKVVLDMFLMRETNKQMPSVTIITEEAGPIPGAFAFGRW
jgi:hypothetical protein